MLDRVVAVTGGLILGVLAGLFVAIASVWLNVIGFADTRPVADPVRFANACALAMGVLGAFLGATARIIRKVTRP
jgi:hypothetical protein